MQLQTTSPESKFPKEYTDAIFIQIDQHLKKLLPKYKGGSDFMKHGVEFHVEFMMSNVVMSFMITTLILAS